MNKFKSNNKGTWRTQTTPRHAIMRKWEYPDYCLLYLDDDPDHTQNLIGSKLDQDQSSDFFHDVKTSSICVILLTNRQTNGNEIMFPWQM